MRRPSSRQRGFLLVTAVFMIVIVALLATVITFLTAGNVLSGGQHAVSAKALFVAESGLERALYGFNREGVACAALSYSAAVGEGNFATTGTPYAPAATALSATISPTDPVIPVLSVAGYAPFGRLTIQSEEINYAAVGTTPAACAPFVAPCFTGARRGAGGTTPATHVALAAVSQDQCLIASTGTVDNAVRTAQAAARASASIARPGASTRSTQNNANSVFTWTHTVTGADRLLIVGVSIRNSSGQTVQPAGVTYAGVPMSQVPGSVATNGTNVRTELWYLPAPALGANTVSVTLSASARMIGGAVSLTGVDQVTPLELPAATNIGACALCAPTASVNVTTTTNNAWIVDVLAWRLTSTVANVGAGRVQQWNRTTGGGWQNGVGGAGASTDAPVTPPATVLVDWTLGGALFHTWAISAVAVRPVGGGGGVLAWRESF